MPNVHNDPKVTSAPASATGPKDARAAEQAQFEIDSYHELATNPDLQFNFHPKLTAWRFELAVLKASMEREEPNATRLTSIATNLRTELIAIALRRPLVLQSIRENLSDEKIEGLLKSPASVDPENTYRFLMQALKQIESLSDTETAKVVQAKIEALGKRLAAKDEPQSILFDALLYCFGEVRKLKEIHNQEMSQRGNPFVEQMAIDIEKDFYYGHETIPYEQLATTKTWIEEIVASPEQYGLLSSQLNDKQASSRLTNAGLARIVCGAEPLFPGLLPDTLMRDYDQLSKIHDDCHLLARAAVSLSVFEALMKEAHVVPSKEQIGVLRHEISRLLKDSGTGPKEIADAVMNHAEVLCDREGALLDDLQKGSFRSVIERGMTPEDPLFKSRCKRVGTLLQAKLNNDPGFALLVTQKGLDGFAEQLDSVGKHLSRIARVFHGVHATTLQSMIIQTQQQNLVKDVLTERIQSDADLPECYQHALSEAQTLGAEYRAIKAKAGTEAMEAIQEAFVALNEYQLDDELQARSALKPFEKEIRESFNKVIGFSERFRELRQREDQRKGITNLRLPLKSGFNLLS